MSSSTQESRAANGDASQRRYKGVRRRKWGKWVSEIRVPGTQERLWLGSYTNPEAAAVAHDVAFYCLRGNSSPKNLNFPLMLPSNARVGMPPESVQQSASDAGLAVDARLLDSKNDEVLRDEDGKKVDCSEAEGQSRRRPDGAASWGSETSDWWPKTDAQYLSVSVEDYLRS